MADAKDVYMAEAKGRTGWGRAGSNTAAIMPGRTRYEVSRAEANADELARKERCPDRRRRSRLGMKKPACGHCRQGRCESADEDLECERDRR